jgi:hypothetical protein
VDDLWPDDILFLEQRAPVTILKDQAFALGKRTQNIVIADVRSHQDVMGTRKFEHSFVIRAPSLNYEYQLFSVTHDIELYPVQLFFEDFKEGRAFAGSEREFLRLLQEVLSSDKTRKVVAAIYAQTQHP